MDSDVGVKIKHWVAPKKVLVKNGTAVGLRCDYVTDVKGKLVATGETFDIAADMIFKAIGQTAIDVTGGALALSVGRLLFCAEKGPRGQGLRVGGRCRGRPARPARCCPAGSWPGPRWTRRGPAVPAPRIPSGLC